MISTIVVISSVDWYTPRKFFPSKSSLQVKLLFRWWGYYSFFRLLLQWWLFKLSLCTLALSSAKEILLLDRRFCLILIVCATYLPFLFIVDVSMSLYNLFQLSILLVNIVVALLLISRRLRCANMISHRSRSLCKLFPISWSVR